MLSGDNRSLTYNSVNKPTYIEQNGQTSRFSYGPDHQRYKQVITGKMDKTVYYVGGYEKEVHVGQTIHRIQIGDVAVVEKVDDNAESIYYTLRDHLGSLIATISDSGDVTRLFYDPWGKRLDLPVPEALPTTLFSLSTFLTPRGYTGHEHLDNAGLIHMNGRVYDPEIARFVSVDPFIQSPTYLQSHNRYSYTWNNPLRFIDPNWFRMVDAEYTGDPRDNNESNSRFGNDSGPPNNLGNDDNDNNTIELETITVTASP